MKPLLFAMILWIGVAAQPSAAQPTLTEFLSFSKPVVTERERDATIWFEVTNTSSKTIAGCKLLIEIVKAGQPAGTSYGSIHSDLAGTGSMAPHRVWPVELFVTTDQARGLTEGDIRISADYLVFEDKSSWGPDVEKLGRSIKAEIAGARAERRRLKMLLKKHGPEKVLEDLERPDSPGGAW